MPNYTPEELNSAKKWMEGMPELLKAAGVDLNDPFSLLRLRVKNLPTEINADTVLKGTPCALTDLKNTGGKEEFWSYATPYTLDEVPTRWARKNVIPLEKLTDEQVVRLHRFALSGQLYLLPPKLDTTSATEVRAIYADDAGEARITRVLDDVDEGKIEKDVIEEERKAGTAVAEPEDDAPQEQHAAYDAWTKRVSEETKKRFLAEKEAFYPGLGKEKSLENFARLERVYLDPNELFFGMSATDSDNAYRTKHVTFSLETAPIAVRTALEGVRLTERDVDLLSEAQVLKSVQDVRKLTPEEKRFLDRYPPDQLLTIAKRLRKGLMPRELEEALNGGYLLDEQENPIELEGTTMEKLVTVAYMLMKEEKEICFDAGNGKQRLIFNRGFYEPLEAESVEMAKRTLAEMRADLNAVTDPKDEKFAEILRAMDGVGRKLDTLTSRDVTELPNEFSSINQLCFQLRWDDDKTHALTPEKRNVLEHVYQISSKFSGGPEPVERYLALYTPEERAALQSKREARIELATGSKVNAARDPALKTEYARLSKIMNSADFFFASAGRDYDDIRRELKTVSKSGGRLTDAQCVASMEKILKNCESFLERKAGRQLTGRKARQVEAVKAVKDSMLEKLWLLRQAEVKVGVGTVKADLAKQRLRNQNPREDVTPNKTPVYEALNASERKTGTLLREIGLGKWTKQAFLRDPDAAKKLAETFLVNRIRAERAGGEDRAQPGEFEKRMNEAFADPAAWNEVIGGLAKSDAVTSVLERMRAEPGFVCRWLADNGPAHDSAVLFAAERQPKAEPAQKVVPEQAPAAPNLN